MLRGKTMKQFLIKLRTIQGTWSDSYLPSISQDIADNVEKQARKQ
jgi:hypothetical protein